MEVLVALEGGGGAYWYSEEAQEGLKELVSASRSEKGGVELAELGAAARAAALVCSFRIRDGLEGGEGGASRDASSPPPPPAAGALRGGGALPPTSLLLLLRLLRNLCAFGPGTPSAILDAHAHVAAAEIAAELAAAVCEGGTAPPPGGVGGGEGGCVSRALDVVVAAVQMLSNLCVGNEAAQAAVWGACFPGVLVDLAAAVRSAKVHQPLCAILHMCARGSSSRAAQLRGEQGAPLIAALVRAIPTPETEAPAEEASGGGDGLQILLLGVCEPRGGLEGLFRSLSRAGVAAWGGEPAGAEAVLVPVPAHSNALRVLGESLARDASEGRGRIPTASAQFLVSFAARAAEAVVEAQAATGGGEGVPEAAMGGGAGGASAHGAALRGVAAVGSLASAMRVLRVLSSRDDGGGRDDGHEHDTIRTLVDRGLILQMLAMLYAQGQPRAPKGSGGGVRRSEADGSMPAAPALPPASAEVIEASGRYPRCSPYVGYRRDLVAVVGNACHGRQATQTEVKRLGGVELVLTNSQLDEDSPFVREWALWGVRNMCEGNDAIQQSIRDLQVVGAKQNEDLAAAGLRVEMDDISKQPRIVRVDADAVEGDVVAEELAEEGHVRLKKAEL